MDQEFLFNRNISRNSSVGLSSRIYYCRSTAEGVPFNWEMQPGTPRDPPKEEAIPPISPPPAALSLGLPKLYLDQHSNPHHKPPTSPLKRLKFWRKSKKNKQHENHNATQHDHNNVGVFGGSGRFEFCSSDSEFIASSTSSRNSSSSSSSSFSLSKGRLSRQCSGLRSTPAMDSLSRSGHFSCNPWNFSSVIISIARRV